jgi:type II secretory pathway pseudopilin PulG
MRARDRKAAQIGERRRGMGLIEVLVATTLALVLIVGAAEMLTLALGAKRRADVTAALTHALGDRLESLKSRPFDDPALAAGEYGETGRVEPGRALVAAAWGIEDEGDGMKKVTLSVRCAGRPGPATTAIAYILRDLGFGP